MIGLRRTLNNFIRKDAPGIVTRSIMKHVSEVMTNHYSMSGAPVRRLPGYWAHRLRKR